MSTSVAEAAIARPASEVWAYAADIPHHTDWMSVTSARITRGSGTEVGARGLERLVLGPIAWDIEFEVTESVPGRRIVWRSIDDPHGEFEVVLDLEPADDGTTRARYQGSATMRGRWRLLAPLLAMEGAAGVRRELGQLKDRVEADRS